MDRGSRSSKKHAAPPSCPPPGLPCRSSRVEPDNPPHWLRGPPHRLRAVAAARGCMLGGVEHVVGAQVLDELRSHHIDGLNRLGNWHRSAAAGGHFDRLGRETARSRSPRREQGAHWPFRAYEPQGGFGRLALPQVNSPVSNIRLGAPFCAEFEPKNICARLFSVALFQVAKAHSDLVRSMPSMITQLWRDRLDVIFPRSCVHCGGIVEGGRLRHLCPACERHLLVVGPPHCTTCGQVN